MKARPEIRDEHEPSIAADIIVGTLGLLWQAVRVPAHALLRLIERPVRLILGVVGFLSVFTAFLFRFASSEPYPHFWGMLGFGIACGLGLLLYEGLMRLLAR
jgi:hypothetical protein